MPHICTRCDNVFESGEDILKGCPVCGWKKFLFVGKRSLEKKAVQSQTEQIITEAMGVRIPPKRILSKEIEKSQSSAKLVSQESANRDAPQVDGITSKGEKLESIRITAPGTYELNLPTLFERDELILAIKEGTYFIDLSSAFKKGKKE